MRTITACDRCLYPIKASTVFFFPYISFLPSFVSFFSLLFSSTAAAAVVQFRKKESVKRRKKRYVHVSGQAHMFPFQLISSKISMPKNTFRKCSFSGVCAVRAFFHRYSFAFCSCCFWTFLFSFTSSFSRRSRIDRSVACLPACIEKRERKRERWNGWPKRLFTWPAQPKEMKKNMLNRRTFLKKERKNHQEDMNKWTLHGIAHDATEMLNNLTTKITKKSHKCDRLVYDSRSLTLPFLPFLLLCWMNINIKV